MEAAAAGGQRRAGSPGEDPRRGSDTGGDRRAQATTEETRTHETEAAGKVCLHLVDWADHDHLRAVPPLLEQGGRPADGTDTGNARELQAVGYRRDREASVEQDVLGATHEVSPKRIRFLQGRRNVSSTLHHGRANATVEELTTPPIPGFTDWKMLNKEVRVVAKCRQMLALIGGRATRRGGHNADVVYHLLTPGRRPEDIEGNEDYLFDFGKTRRRLSDYEIRSGEFPQRFIECRLVIGTSRLNDALSRNSLASMT